MKRLLVILGIMVLLFGCIATNGEEAQEPLPTGNVSEEASLEEYIEISFEDGTQIIEISAFEDSTGWNFPEEYAQNMEWYFPLKIYEDEFVSIGQYQDYFIKLDEEYVPSLADGESIWLYPMVVKNSSGQEGENVGILFKAFHSNDVGCNTEIINILGKTYHVENFEDGSSFLNDDKWKVALDYEGECLKRVIIYLDGYFYDLKDGERTDLFFNDGTLTLEFHDLKNKPKIVIKLTQ